MTDLEKQMADALRVLVKRCRTGFDGLPQGQGIRMAEEALAKFDAQAAEQAAGDGEAVAWRPKLKDRPKHLPESDFTAGKPSAQTLEYWSRQGVEIEYAYTHPAPAAPSDPKPEGMPTNALASAACSVAEARGFVAFGAGVYRIQETQEPGLVVTFRRDGEQHYGVGDLAPEVDTTPIQADDIIARLQFTSVAGLDSLEHHLRSIRAQHWPETAPSTAPAESPAAPVQQVGERERSTLSPDDIFRLADEQAEDSQESGNRVFDRGGLIQFARDIEARAAISTRPELSEAEIDALRRDAERYRAIRDDDCHPYGICIWDEDDGWAQDARKPDVVDAAIDAALAAARGEKR